MAEELSGYVKAELNEDLEENEFYLQDLIGLKVINVEEKEIGTVKNFTESGQTLIFIKLKKNLKRKMICSFLLLKGISRKFH